MRRSRRGRSAPGSEARPPLPETTPATTPGIRATTPATRPTPAIPGTTRATRATRVTTPATTAAPREPVGAASASPEADALALTLDPVAGYTEDIEWRPGSFSGTPLVERVAEELGRGATLVLQALHLHWPAAALYCRALEASLGCPVQANAYLTPATSRGFAVHHDTHDVFVLQVSGRKRWRVYEPVLELPLKHQRWSPGLGDPGPPVDEFTLEAGQTLYLPRGWPHEATTAEDESLHLTVGLHPTTRMDALRMALDSCADDPEFRRSLPADGALPKDLLERLAARLEPDEVARRARRRFVAGRRPVLHDQLSQVRDLESLTATALLERRPTVIAELEEEDDAIVLVFEGKEIRFPSKAAPAVRAAYGAAHPFRAADLPGPLDMAGRLVLVRRLVREGFLRRPRRRV